MRRRTFLQMLGIGTASAPLALVGSSEARTEPDALRARELEQPPLHVVKVDQCVSLDERMAILRDLEALQCDRVIVVDSRVDVQVIGPSRSASDEFVKLAEPHYGEVGTVTEIVSSNSGWVHLPPRLVYDKKDKP